MIFLIINYSSTNKLEETIELIIFILIVYLICIFNNKLIIN